MGTQRYLIVNADDFGLSSGVNQGIIRAFEDGIVTSASLMVQHPAAVEAACYARRHPDLSVGLHLDLGEWIYHDGAWRLKYQVVPPEDAALVEREAESQLAAFRALMESDPTHLDSHQHLHLGEPAKTVATAMAATLGVPLRHCDHAIRYCGHFYGQTDRGEPWPDGLGVDALIEVLIGLPSGMTELGCHPGLDHDLDSTYRAERRHEVETLCDPRVAEAIQSEGMTLISFRAARQVMA